MANDPDHFLGKSLHQFQRFVRQSGAAAGAAYTLMGAILFLGTLGFFLDQYFQSSPLWLLLGLGLGIVVGFYELAKTVFKK
jgi:F0F1-type ATP synthase assembly protein I